MKGGVPPATRSPWLTVTDVRQRVPDANLGAGVAGGFLLVDATLAEGERLVLRADGNLLAVVAARANAPTVFPLAGLVLRPAFEVQVSASRGDDVRPVGRVAGTADFSTIAAGGRSPLLVVGAGRTGTTLFMRLLREHPQVAMVDEYPYEARHAVAIVQQLLATAGAGGQAGDLTPGDLADPLRLRSTTGNPFFAPKHALFEWLATEQFAQRVGHAQELLRALYDEVDRIAGRSSVLFAEKFVPAHLRHALGHLYPGTRTVVLIRDPRDVALSQLAFNQRRGYEGFGLEGHGVVERTCQIADTQLANLEELRRASAPGALVVLRYEDLIADTGRALAGALGELGLDAGAGVVGEMVEAAASDTRLRKRHMTARNADASVGRWRRSFSKDDRSAVSARAGASLQALGYSPS